MTRFHGKQSSLCWPSLRTIISSLLLKNRLLKTDALHFKVISGHSWKPPFLHWSRDSFSDVDSFVCLHLRKTATHLKPACWDQITSPKLAVCGSKNLELLTKKIWICAKERWTFCVKDLKGTLPAPCLMTGADGGGGFLGLWKINQKLYMRLLTNCSIPDRPQTLFFYVQCGQFREPLQKLEQVSLGTPAFVWHL